MSRSWLLLIGGLAGCGKTSSDAANQAAGTAAAAAAAATSGGLGGVSGGLGGVSGGSAAGGMGQVGVPSVNRKCLPRSFEQADGLCYCQPSALTFCPDGCYDPQTDLDHCGDCNTKCATTQACSGGKCGATPSIVVPAAKAAHHVRADRRSERMLRQRCGANGLEREDLLDLACSRQRRHQVGAGSAQPAAHLEARAGC